MITCKQKKSWFRWRSVFDAGCRRWMLDESPVSCRWWATERVDAERTAKPRRRPSLMAWQVFQQVQQRPATCHSRTHLITRRASRALICPLELYHTETTRSDPRQDNGMSATPSIGRTPMSPRLRVDRSRVPTSGCISYRLHVRTIRSRYEQSSVTLQTYSRWHLYRID